MSRAYITTSIAYTNAKPHIGYCLELLQADVIARYNRQQGREVWFLTGTDEHGSKIANKAKEQGKTPQDFCDEIVTGFKTLKPLLGLSNDDFIRTTDQKRHWPTVWAIWQKLKEQGDIYKKKYKGLYCVGCEAFVKEKDLVDGKCPIHEKPPEVIKEENYFFRLSKYQNQLEKIIKAEKIKIIPETRRAELLSFIIKGLEDVSCSRPREKLEWGIPVPDDKTQTVYVWLEALVNYISVLDYTTKGNKFKKFWPPDVHCIGKDIFVRFHGSLWPAMLLSLKLSLPKTIFVHGFINVEGQKMSKSLGNIIDPFELVKKYGTDAVRYFLLRESSPFDDLDFTFEKFEKRYNSDMADGLGNLVARIITLTAKLKIKDLRFKIKDSRLNKEIEKTGKNWGKALNEFKFNEALISIWELISFCDHYIEKEKPWELIKSKVKNRASEGSEGEEEDGVLFARRKSKVVISNLLLALKEIAKLLQPFLPQTSEKIGEQIKTKKTKPLFPRIK